MWEIAVGSAKPDAICRVVREGLFDKLSLKKSGACEGGRLWDIRGRAFQVRKQVQRS